MILFFLFINLIVAENFYLDLIGFNKNNLFNTTLYNLRKNYSFHEISNMNNLLKFETKESRKNFFVILIASYNNIKYYEKNIKSVLDQNYQNYIAIYMDDISIDGTAEAVEQYLNDYDKNNHFILIKNVEKKYCLKNYIDAINSFCLDNTIIVTLDGDDWFSRNDVLEVLNNIYNDGKTWITTGDPLVYSNILWNDKHSDCAVDKHWKNPHNEFFFNIGIRNSKFWYFFHLRSFYTSLFLKINNEDFLDQCGEYFKFTEDVAFMLPMLEMAGLEHYTFINYPALYVYNNINSITTAKVWERKRIDSTFDFIFSKKAYSKLDKLEALD